MAKGFEDYTYSLTELEVNTLIPAIVKAWQRKSVGQKVSANTMIEGLNMYCEKCNILNSRGKSYKVHGARFRKMIHYIRNNNLVPNLIASQSGYWKSDDYDEISSFVKSCYERGSSLVATAQALSHYTKTKINE